MKKTMEGQVPPAEVKRQLRQWMKRNDVSFPEMAAAIGSTPASLRTLFCQKSDIYIGGGTAAKISVRYGLNVNFLMAGLGTLTDEKPAAEPEAEKSSEWFAEVSARLDRLERLMEAMGQKISGMKVNVSFGD